jgi:hypothetical protein
MCTEDLSLAALIKSMALLPSSADFEKVHLVGVGEVFWNSMVTTLVAVLKLTRVAPPV